MRLLPEQVSARWGVLRPMLMDSLPVHVSGSQQAMTNILASILRGELVIWFVSTQGVVTGLISTIINVDAPTGQKTCLLYTATNIDDSVILNWTKGLGLLAKYAKSRDCVTISGVTDNGELGQKWERIGGKAQLLLSLNV